MMTFDRRHFLTLAGTGAATMLFGGCRAAPASPPEKFEFQLSDAEWRKRLPALSYQVLRHENTEIPGTGPYYKERRKGMYHCRGCDLPLFKSDWKYDHDGWPSFFDVNKANIGTKTDRTLGTARRWATAGATSSRTRSRSSLSTCSRHGKSSSRAPMPWSICW